MKEAKEIINRGKDWLNKDQKNRTAVIILADKKESSACCHSEGTTQNIAQLIYTLMTKNKRLGYSIYSAAHR